MRLIIMMMRKTTAAVSLVKTMGFLLCLLVVSASSSLTVLADQSPGGKGLQNGTILTAPPSGQSIPWSGLGAKATEQAGGKGLSITPTARGAKLECALQRLEGEVTPAGFTVTTTAKDASADRFTLKASGMGRGEGLPQALAETGRITVDPGMVRRVRPNVVEEYSVSADGIRQDFMILSRPEGQGPLFLQLALSGATAAASGEGTILTLGGSGRKLAYGKLHVMDAKGHDLPARFRVAGTGASEIGIEVDDANAAYPIRIDPTITDDDWVSMNPEIPGPNGNVKAIAIHGSVMYIGGDFTAAGRVMANHIAKWDGANWSALGSGIDGDVSALAMDDLGNLYAGGTFTTAGGVSANHIAKWNGSDWSAPGSGINGEVSALAVDGDGNLYVGGHFTTAGDVTAYNIAKWDGTNWSAMGSGMDGTDSYIYALTTDGAGNLYAGGHFTTAGDVSANNIAKWDGTAWSAMGLGIGGTYHYLSVNALGVDGGGNLYAGGRFNTAGGVSANKIAKWDGAAWSALGSGMGEYSFSGTVSTLALDGDGNLYAGGRFILGDFDASRIAKWDGANWNILRSGIDLNVSALGVDGEGNLYAGGDITDNFGWRVLPTILHIAKWDGTDWSALGAGSLLSKDGGMVLALAVDGTDLYAGGSFTVLNGVSAKGIVKWDGTSWSSLGSGIGVDHRDAVNALAADGTGNLYAGGLFETAGDVAANNIARWDGSTWSVLGSGLGFGGMDSDKVNALAVDSAGNLYAGGLFTTAGGVTVNRIAKWNGARWRALGSGVDGYVNALVVDSAGNLYAGGAFQTAGGVAANNIAKWDGTSWSALGNGIDELVHNLAVDGAGKLYADIGITGFFCIGAAQWDGSNWRSLEAVCNDGDLEGFNNYDLRFLQHPLAVDGAGNLYAGGGFTGILAQWNGTEWNALGSGFGDNYPAVSALSVDGSNNLYAAGSFITAGNKVSPYIAKCRIPYSVSFQINNAFPGATLTGQTSQLIYHGENGSSVTAVAPAGYVFWKWTLAGADYSAVNPLAVTSVTRDMTLTAVFGIGLARSLTYTAGAGGTISGVSPQIVANGASGTAVTAVPDSGYRFVQWSDGVTENPRTDTQVTADVNVSAQYEESKKSGGGGGGCFVDVLMW